MGYATFFVLNFLFIWLVLFAFESFSKIDGVVALGCLVYFWGSFWFFHQWKLYDSPVKSLSDRALQSLLNDWTKAIFRYRLSLEHIVRSRGNPKITAKMMRRLIEIHEELIHRKEQETSKQDASRDLRESLERLKNDYQRYCSSE